MWLLVFGPPQQRYMVLPASGRLVSCVAFARANLLPFTNLSATTTPCLPRRCCLLQVCGGYTEQMAQVAQLLDEQLGDNIDFVDINCGEALTAS